MATRYLFFRNPPLGKFMTVYVLYWVEWMESLMCANKGRRGGGEERRWACLPNPSADENTFISWRKGEEVVEVEEEEEEEEEEGVTLPHKGRKVGPECKLQFSRASIPASSSS